jgi:hypothetical protein
MNFVVVQQRVLSMFAEEEVSSIGKSYFFIIIYLYIGKNRPVNLTYNANIVPDHNSVTPLSWETSDSKRIQQIDRLIFDVFRVFSRFMFIYY